MNIFLRRWGPLAFSYQTTFKGWSPKETKEKRPTTQQPQVFWRATPGHAMAQWIHPSGAGGARWLLVVFFFFFLIAGVLIFVRNKSLAVFENSGFIIDLLVLYTCVVLLWLWFYFGSKNSFFGCFWCVFITLWTAFSGCFLGGALGFSPF